jgi:predicted Zn-dependent protease
MKIVTIILAICSVLYGCLAPARPVSWNLKDLADAQNETHNLEDSAGFGFKLPTKTLKDVTAVYIQLKEVIKDIVVVDAELLIVESTNANAYVAIRRDKPVICITAPMMILLGSDLNLYAALLSHEVAHLAWGHLEEIRKRRNLLSAAGLVLSPAFIVAPIGLAAIDAAYNRDQEREADALAIELMIGAKFDPNAAIRFHEKLREHSAEVSPFIATHPASDERIRNIRRIIETSNSKR